MEGATKPHTSRSRRAPSRAKRPQDTQEEARTVLDTTPYWLTEPIRDYPQLDRDLRVDVAIVGGGITGVTAAYLLKSAGRKVALLDRRRCAEADTGHTTAHLTFVTDERLTQLVKRFGDDHARAVWDAGLAALATIDAIVQREKIDCDFEWVPAYLHTPLGGSEEEDLEALRAEASEAQRLGYSAAFHERIPFLDRPGVEFEGQARFHPRKYLAALLERIDGDGSFVFENSNVEDVIDEPLRLRANGHAVGCDYVVVGTHAPIQGKTGFLRASVLQTKAGTLHDLCDRRARARRCAARRALLGRPRRLSLPAQRARRRRRDRRLRW
jgi:glycine/D-amino acid oxidase-like deaminating enzyme